jgi:hypothetical protein
MIRKLALAVAAFGVATTLSTLPAFAQSAAPDLQSAVGDWLYDSHGNLVGAVDAIVGQTALIRYGSNMTWGQPIVSVPASEISVVGNHAVLRTFTAAELALHRVD